MSSDTQETADRFRESLGLPFPLVGDPAGAVIKAYKASWPILNLARRVTYLVGRDGKIEKAHWSELDAAGHVAEACSL